MSGAEGIAGLALGAISVAGLFTTCIQCFDIVIVGKNFSEDYEQLCTLVSAFHPCMVAREDICPCNWMGNGSANSATTLTTCLKAPARLYNWSGVYQDLQVLV